MESRRTAWVTGATSGIGRATAIALASHGWRVGIGARSSERLRATGSSLDGDGHAAAEVDVRDAASVRRWAETLRGETGHPDLVVTCAGWAVFRKVAETSDEEWARMLDTNLTGLFLVTRETLPGMLARGSGHFIHVLSVASRTAFSKNGAYNASKFGALGFTEALRAEVRGKGIRVTAVLPGATDTPLWDQIDGDWDRSRMMPPSAVARAIVHAAETPPDALVEEIRIAPPLGNL